MRKVLFVIRDGYSHFRPVGVIVNRYVFDIGQIVEVELELLFLKGCHFGAHIFVGVMAERF